MVVIGAPTYIMGTYEALSLHMLSKLFNMNFSEWSFASSEPMLSATPLMFFRCCLLHNSMKVPQRLGRNLVGLARDLMVS